MTPSERRKHAKRIERLIDQLVRRSTETSGDEYNEVMRQLRDQRQMLALLKGGKQ